METTSGPSRSPRKETHSPPDPETLRGCAGPRSFRLDLDESTVQVLVSGQADALGVTAAGVREAELSHGARIDPRVDEAQLDEIAGHYFNAQRRFLGDVEARRLAPPVGVLFAPTARVVDHKIDDSALTIICDRLIREGKLDDLRQAIANGPGGGEIVWERPENPVQLMASMVRWGLERPGDKKRIRTGAELREWIGETLADAGYDTKPRLGGVSAVGTALAKVLGREPTMMSLGSLPPDIIAHLDPGTRIVGSDPAHSTLDELPREARAGGHYCLSFHGRELRLSGELRDVMIGDTPRSTGEIRSLDVLVTGSVTVQGFEGIDTERMRSIARDNELMILSGVQALSSPAEISDFFEHVSAAHGEGMRVALLYSESKFPALENDAWAEMRRTRCVDFIGINTAEAFDVLGRIVERGRLDNPLGLSAAYIERAEQALALGGSAKTPWESGREAPEWLFRSAALLQEALEVPLVRVRGKACDVTIAADDVAIPDPDSVRDHLIVSRHMGTLKVANETGLIDQTDELGFLRNIPHGEHLAALHAIADEIGAYARGRPDPAARAGGDPYIASGDPARDCFALLADGRACFAVPPVPFYDRRGGTQSAGDTIDVTFTTEELDGALLAAHAANERRRGC